MLKYEDPAATTLISIRAAVSMLTQSKWETQPEDISIPTLIFQPSADRMTPPPFAKGVYDRLNCSKKWIDLKGSDHMTTKSHYFEKIWSPEVDKWLREVL
ncbi:MAG: hypothetical protein GY730_04760 [bacterium]|nr:hypothetical protein [bacterium]